MCDIWQRLGDGNMWHVWHSETYQRSPCLPLILFALMIHPSYTAATRGKMVIAAMEKCLFICDKSDTESRHVRSVTKVSVMILCLWSGELSINNERFQPSPCPLLSLVTVAKSIKSDFTYGYLARACRAFFGKSSQLILFYDLNVCGLWVAVAGREGGAVLL